MCFFVWAQTRAVAKGERSVCESSQRAAAAASRMHKQMLLMVARGLAAGAQALVLSMCQAWRQLAAVAKVSQGRRGPCAAYAIRTIANAEAALLSQSFGLWTRCARECKLAAVASTEERLQIARRKALAALSRCFATCSQERCLVCVKSWRGTVEAESATRRARARGMSRAVRSAAVPVEALLAVFVRFWAELTQDVVRKRSFERESRGLHRQRIVALSRSLLQTDSTLLAASLRAWQGAVHSLQLNRRRHDQALIRTAWMATRFAKFLLHHTLAAWGLQAASTKHARQSQDWAQQVDAARASHSRSVVARERALQALEATLMSASLCFLLACMRAWRETQCETHLRRTCRDRVLRQVLGKLGCADTVWRSRCFAAWTSVTDSARRRGCRLRQEQFDFRLSLGRLRDLFVLLRAVGVWRYACCYEECLRALAESTLPSSAPVALGSVLFSQVSPASPCPAAVSARPAGPMMATVQMDTIQPEARWPIDHVPTFVTVASAPLAEASSASSATFALRSMRPSSAHTVASLHSDARRHLLARATAVGSNREQPQSARR